MVFVENNIVLTNKNTSLRRDSQKRDGGNNGVRISHSKDEM